MSGVVYYRTVLLGIHLASLYPNIFRLQSIAISNKNTVLHIVHELQCLLWNGHCLLHQKVEHTLAARHELLPYIAVHCMHSLTTCHDITLHLCTL